MVIDQSKIITADFDIPPGMIDLSIGQPGMSLLPLAALAQAAEHCLSQNNPYILAYGAEQGNWYFRRALAGFLSGAYNFSVDPDHLFTTAGASQAMAFAFSLARIHPIESTAQLYDFIVFFEKRICLRFIA